MYFQTSKIRARALSASDRVAFNKAYADWPRRGEPGVTDEWFAALVADTGAAALPLAAGTGRTRLCVAGEMIVDSAVFGFSIFEFEGQRMTHVAGAFVPTQRGQGTCSVLAYNLDRWLFGTTCGCLELNVSAFADAPESAAGRYICAKQGMTLLGVRTHTNGQRMLDYQFTKAAWDAFVRREPTVVDSTYTTVGDDG